jgi:hypothetical protein
VARRLQPPPPHPRRGPQRTAAAAALVLAVLLLLAAAAAPAAALLLLLVAALLLPQDLARDRGVAALRLLIVRVELEHVEDGLGWVRWRALLGRGVGGRGMRSGGGGGVGVGRGGVGAWVWEGGRGWGGAGLGVVGTAAAPTTPVPAHPEPLPLPRRGAQRHAPCPAPLPGPPPRRPPARTCGSTASSSEISWVIWSSASTRSSAGCTWGWPLLSKPAWHDWRGGGGGVGGRPTGLELSSAAARGAAHPHRGGSPSLSSLPFRLAPQPLPPPPRTSRIANSPSMVCWQRSPPPPCPSAPHLAPDPPASHLAGREQPLDGVLAALAPPPPCPSAPHLAPGPQLRTLRIANSPSMMYWQRLSIAPSCRIARKRSNTECSPAGATSCAREGGRGRGGVWAGARARRRLGAAARAPPRGRRHCPSASPPGPATPPPPPPAPLGRAETAHLQVRAHVLAEVHRHLDAVVGGVLQHEDEQLERQQLVRDALVDEVRHELDERQAHGLVVGPLGGWLWGRGGWGGWGVSGWAVVRGGGVTDQWLRQAGGRAQRARRSRGAAPAAPHP